MAKLPGANAPRPPSPEERAHHAEITRIEAEHQAERRASDFEHMLTERYAAPPRRPDEPREDYLRRAQRAIQAERATEKETPP